MMHFAIFFFFNCLYSSISDAAKLPADIGRCNPADPEINACLTKNIEVAIKKFENGEPQLGIPVFEPLKITKMVIGEGSGPVNVVQDFSNAELYGLTGSSVLNATMDLNNDKLYAESITPSLELVGDYNLDGKILVLPIRGTGKFNITLINSKLTHDLTMEKYTKKGKTYWRMIDYVVSIKPERMYYHFDNLFDGDERLGSEINKVLNENWDSIFNDVSQGYEKSFGLIFKGLADSLFRRVSLKDIFLED